MQDALAAIAAKGVTVPQGATSDDLATLIEQISAGGSTRTIVIPEQTITAESEYTVIANYAEALVIGDEYICTVDGVEYGPYYGIDYYGSVAIGSRSANGWIFEYDRGMYFTASSSVYGTHTVKVEKNVSS